MPRHIIDLGIQSITGRIGINTSSPLYDFDVNGTGYFRSGLLVSGQISTSQRPVVNGTGVLLIGEVSATLPDTLVYTTGNQTISGIKTFSERMDVSGIKFRVLTGAELPPAYQEGLVWYNDDNKALNYYNDISTAPVALAQEQIVRGTNNLGFQINKGQVVYITGGGGGGDRFPAFQLSIASGEGGSARTIGVATSNILNNEKGYAVSFGRLEGIDTSTYNVGQTLYLSWEASGGFTGVKPQAPNHMVRVGTVIRQGNSANGVIFVNIQNGFELEELHNVRIINEQNKDAILWNSASGLWLNRQISTGDVGGIENFVRYDYINKPNSLTVRDNASDVDIFDYVVDDHFILRGLDGLSEVALSPSIGYAYISGVDKIVANASNPANLISGYSVAANSVSVSGNSVLTTESNAVFRTGDQSISGVKTFNDEIIATGIITLSGASALLRQARFDGVQLAPHSNGGAWRVTRNDVPTRTYCYFGYHGGYRVGYWNYSIGTFGWTSSSTDATLDPDTYLIRDAAGIIAQINGVNPQTYRIYNTYSTTGSFERGKIGWNSNVFEVGTEQGSTGGLPRNLALVTSGQQRLTVDTIGRVGIGTTSPSERLNVNGNILVTSYIINASNLSGLDINAIGVNAGDLATGASYSNFFGYWAGKEATSASQSNFLGREAGYQATSANNSFFGGYRAGYQASGANNSNFIGQQAGYGAKSAFYSNFLGQNAGHSSISGDRSNFFGYNAGYLATSAYQSNFLGNQAGESATNAYGSNFLGNRAGYQAATANNSFFANYQAGYQASGANSSNFLGYQAGYQATSATQSNFLGQEAGYQASAAQYSNFLGYWAGLSATSGSQSNFFGQEAGRSATSANYSNFFGYRAGWLATNANNSNFFGQGAGTNATNANNSNFIGNSAGSSATSAIESNFLGYFAGNGAAGAQYSNFLGSSAGRDSTSASYSNFFGVEAGRSAISGNYSNFFGQRAGYVATSAARSNFFGLNAGDSATNASHSNFFGNTAGASAINASHSNFLGYQAGYQASGLNNSNFLGQSAGYQATSATQSNFLGREAGYQATSANDSFFAGYRAGYQASGTAYHSVFIGNVAGYQATNAYYSNFLGNYAGYSSDSANNSNFFGREAGRGALAGNNSNFFGNGAGYLASGASNSNFFGLTAGSQASGAANSNFLGQLAGYQATNAASSNFIGSSAGYLSTNALQSNFLGPNAGSRATNASYSNFMGNGAGYLAIDATYSNFLGRDAGLNASGASHSNFFGNQAGYQSSGASYSTFVGYTAGKNATNANNSIFIGRNAGLSDTVNNSAGNKSSILIGNYTSTSGYSDSIAIGQGVANSAAQQLNIGNVLYATSINNGTTPSSTPVLGKVGVRVENPQYTLDVNGSGNFSSGLYVSGNSTFYSNLSISGHLSAVTKAFKINHPTKPGKMLVHGASEAPEWSVFVRGKTSEPIINLPDYWSGLVHEDSVTCTLTPIGKPMSLYVVEQTTERVIVGGLEAGGSYNYVVYGERKDVDKLVPEI